MGFWRHSRSIVLVVLVFAVRAFAVHDARVLAQGRAGNSANGERSHRVASRPSLWPQCGSAQFNATCFDAGQTQLYCPSCGGQAMHGCPAGFAMTGAGSGNNLFRCSYVGAYHHVYFEAGPRRTQRHESIACGSGYFMIGMHEEHNVLACASVGRPVIYERRENVGTITPCDVGSGAPRGVMTGWNRAGRYMLCSQLF